MRWFNGPWWARATPIVLMLLTAIVIKEALDDEDGKVSAALLWGSLAAGVVVFFVAFLVLRYVYRDRSTVESCWTLPPRSE